MCDPLLWQSVLHGQDTFQPVQKSLDLRIGLSDCILWSLPLSLSLSLSLLSLQGLKQHIFAEEAGAKSTRMRAQLGLNTPRKEGGGAGTTMKTTSE